MHKTWVALFTRLRQRTATERALLKLLQETFALTPGVGTKRSGHSRFIFFEGRVLAEADVLVLGRSISGVCLLRRLLVLARLVRGVADLLPANRFLVLCALHVLDMLLELAND